MADLIQAVRTADAPAAKGPYNQGVVGNGVVYVSGQLPLDPATGKIVDGDFRAQAAQAIRNVEAVLKAGGSDLSHVLRINVFLADMGKFGEFNEVYEAMIPSPYPARTARGVDLGPYALEIDATALVAVQEGECHGL